MEQLQGEHNSPLVDLTPEERKILQGSYLCTSGLLFLLQRSKDYWTRIINDAMDYGSARPHGNFGKKKGVVTSMEVFQPLKEFFQMLEAQCEVRATEVVRTIAGVRNNTEDVNVLYLPTWYTLRGMYRNYLESIGYSLEFFNDGNYRVGEWSGDEGDVKHPYVSLGSFYSLWKKEFAHIKVSKPSEDICTLCHCFANRHKYCIGSTANSSADATLFLPEYMPDAETVQSDEEEDREQSTGGGGTEGGRGGANAKEEPETDNEERECYEIERILGADLASGDKDLES